MSEGERRLPEVPAEGRAAEQPEPAAESVERQVLENAAIQPEAVVESGSYQQAEVIENLVTEMAAGQVETPPTTEVASRQANVGIDPVPLPRPAAEVARDESIRGNMPDAQEGELKPAGSESAPEGPSVTPINLPKPVQGEFHPIPKERLMVERDDSRIDKPNLGAIADAQGSGEPSREDITPINLPAPVGAVENLAPWKKEVLTGEGVQVERVFSKFDADGASKNEFMGAKPEGSGSTEDVLKAMGPEQRAIFEQMSKEDQAALMKMVGESQKINPGGMVGRSGGIIY